METGSGAGRIVDLYGGISDTAWKKTGSSVCVDGRTYNRTCKRESVRTNQGRKSRFFGKFLWSLDMLREKLEADKLRRLELEKEKKTLLLSLSHDIRTPLSAIELYTQALEENLYEDEEKGSRRLAGFAKTQRQLRNM